MVRAKGAQICVVIGLALLGSAGCRDYGALELHDAGSQTDDAGPPDLAPYVCSTGLLCETFDNDPLGDNWFPLAPSVGTALVDRTRSYAGPGSLEIYVPATMTPADPAISHMFTFSSSSPALHIREMVYLSSQLAAPVDLVRVAQSGSYSAIWLQAIPVMGGTELSVQSTSDAAAIDSPSVVYDAWSCVEWTLDHGSPSQMGFTSTVAVNGVSSPPHLSQDNPFGSKAPDTIVLGNGVPSAYPGADYWIDSLVVDDAPIGCP